jgi:hypothetical protein
MIRWRLTLSLAAAVAGCATPDTGSGLPTPRPRPVGALVVFVAAVFAAGLLAQRQPPYPM